MDVNILKSTIESMMQVYEANVEVLKICKAKCVNLSDCDMKFISDNVLTLRSNEKYKSVFPFLESMSIHIVSILQNLQKDWLVLFHYGGNHIHGN